MDQRLTALVRTRRQRFSRPPDVEISPMHGPLASPTDAFTIPIGASAGGYNDRPPAQIGLCKYRKERQNLFAFGGSCFAPTTPQWSNPDWYANHANYACYNLLPQFHAPSPCRCLPSLARRRGLLLHWRAPAPPVLFGTPFGSFLPGVQGFQDRHCRRAAVPPCRTGAAWILRVRASVRGPDLLLDPGGRGGSNCMSPFAPRVSRASVPGLKSWCLLI